jgi:D-3-phosphoglycerate dehydrogenase
MSHENPQLKILHLDSNHPLLWQQLQDLGCENHQDYTSTKAEVAAKIHEYHGIVIRSRFTLDRAFLEKATQLKFIARVGAGLESIDAEAAAEHNIALIAAPEGNRNAVGEHTLGMLLSLMNHLNQADAQIRQGQRQREGNRGHELDGKTVGIIGYGNMGKSFAKKLRGFDVEVLCYDIQEPVGDVNAKQVSLEELRQKADVLSLHIPWTPETNGLVNAEFIHAFAKPFWLINTSRGKNVVTADLVTALQSGKIIGAGLDVIEYENLSFETLNSDALPEPYQYLLQGSNVLLTPHIAGWTFESHERLAQVIVDKIKDQIFGLSSFEPQKPKVTGIGGVFFKAKNPKELKAWYAEHLGFPVDEYGCSFWWKDAQGNDAMTQWSLFANDTKYFEPSQAPLMLNYRVDDLAGLLSQLKSSGITVVGEPQSFDYGQFAWILDPEGNKIELWQANDRSFL